MVRSARIDSVGRARVTGWRVALCALVAVALLPLVAYAQSDTERLLPFDWRVRAVDGREIPMARFRGRPIVLNLWATWCTPCVAELGSIERLQDSLRAQGRDDIVFLLVSLETRRSVQRFQDRRPIGLPLFVELDPMPAVLGIRAVPTTWLIDRDGRITATHRGARVWDAPDAIALVQRALPQ
jgi:thiol-disulfide isomerase/thioredoxin